MAYETTPYLERRRAVERASESSGSGRSVAKWLVGFAFFLSMAALLVTLQLFQLTSEGASKRTLRRAVAALTEIDPLIERNYADLKQRASAAAPGETVRLKDYPLDIALTPQEVAAASSDQLRDTLLDRSADLMYREGTAPLRGASGRNSNTGTFSLGGFTNDGLGFLKGRNHDILRVLTFVFAAVSLALAASLAALCRGFGRVASVGGAVTGAGVPLLLAGLGAWLYSRAASGGDTEYTRGEVLSIGRGLAWIPIRDGAAFTVFGLSLLVLGVVGAIWADRRASAY